MYMAHERKQYILHLLEQRGRIRSAELAHELGVTDETIRTDLVSLQKKGLLRRVHGGAEFIVPEPQNSQAELSRRADVQLARLMVTAIPPGSVIYAEACAFTRVLAAQLSDTPCTFVTNSPQLALHLSPQALPHSVICTGGKLDKESKLFYGKEAEQTLRDSQPHFCILRPAALSPTQAGYISALPAHWAALAAACARECFIICPSEHLYRPLQHTVALPQYTLFTEDNLPPSFASIPARTVPYISAEQLIKTDKFDY